MSFANVVPLPGVAGGSLQEESVGAQRASVASEWAAARDEQLGLPVEAFGLPAAMPCLPAAVLGLPAAVLSTASVSLGQPAGEVVSSGFRELDQLLPAGGIRRGSLVEWLPAGMEARLEPPSALFRQAGPQTAGPGEPFPQVAMKATATKAAAVKTAVPRAGGMARGGVQCNASAGESFGSGAFTLAMAIAVQVAGASAGEGDAGGGQLLRGRFQEGSPWKHRVHNIRACGKSHVGAILVVDRSGWFYPPAVMRWLGEGAAGVRCQLIVARPSRDDDEIWTIDQALRCGGVAAVVASPSASIVCSKVMRRWQLAARASGAVGMFVRPWQCRRDPSWAEARLVVMPLHRPRSPAEAQSPSRSRESTQALPAMPPAGAAGAAGAARLAEGRAGRLYGPSVAPRSEAVLRQWRVERLSSLLYGEGRSCEVMLNLERGVEPLQAARLRRQVASLQPIRPLATVPSAALPSVVQPSVVQPSVVQPSVVQPSVVQLSVVQLSVEREPCNDVLQFRVGERQEQDRSETVEGDEEIRKVFRKDGVACRAS